MKPDTIPGRPLWRRRYELLDGWRGVAALAVVLHHVSRVKLGHWAVLVFFVISGYCISASADGCREKGVGLVGFMTRRVRRIYPPMRWPSRSSLRLG